MVSSNSCRCGAERLARRDFADVAVVRGARRLVVHEHAGAAAPRPGLELDRVQVGHVGRRDDVEAFALHPAGVGRLFLGRELLRELVGHDGLLGHGSLSALPIVPRCTPYSAGIQARGWQVSSRRGCRTATATTTMTSEDDDGRRRRWRSAFSATGRSTTSRCAGCCRSPARGGRPTCRRPASGSCFRSPASLAAARAGPGSAARAEPADPPNACCRSVVSVMARSAGAGRRAGAGRGGALAVAARGAALGAGAAAACGCGAVTCLAGGLVLRALSGGRGGGCGVGLRLSEPSAVRIEHQPVVRHRALLGLRAQPRRRRARTQLR